MRQQVVDLRRRVLVDAQPNVLEIRRRVDVVRGAGRDERVETGEVLPALLGTDEEEVSYPFTGRGLDTKREGISRRRSKRRIAEIDSSRSKVVSSRSRVS